MYGWGETKGIDILYSTSTTAVVSKFTLQVSQVANISHVFAFPLQQASIILVSFFSKMIKAGGAKVHYNTVLS